MRPELWSKYVEKLLAGISPEPNTGCWLWSGSALRSGYGVIHHKINRRRFQQYAHRVSFQHHYGVSPGSLLVCHHCDNPPCVNPAHLFLGTHSDNALDMLRKGRARNKVFRGEEHHAHKLTWAAVAEARRLHANGGITYAELGRRFGVGETPMANAIKGKTWRSA